MLASAGAGAVGTVAGIIPGGMVPDGAGAGEAGTVAGTTHGIPAGAGAGVVAITVIHTILTTTAMLTIVADAILIIIPLVLLPPEGDPAVLTADAHRLQGVRTPVLN